MTPEAVIDQYLETAARLPLDPAAFVELLGTDADLLSRWLLLLSCPAEPEAFLQALEQLPAERFRDLALSQALAVLTVSGSVRLSFDQWQSVLTSSLVGEHLAREVGLDKPVAVRWRVLLAASGVNLAQDALLMELLAFRGTRRELLEDASPIHRLFAVVEALDVTDPLVSQEAAQELLGVPPERYQVLVAEAEASCAALLEKLGLSGEGDQDSEERLWLRLQMGILGRLFPAGADLAGLLETHAMVCRRLFGRVPELLLVDPAGGALRSAGSAGPDISLDSQTSTIARCARLVERFELIDRADQAVADRQVLRHLGTADAVCLPLVDSTGGVAGVLVYAMDEDVDQELAMGLYAAELGRRLMRAPGGAEGASEALLRYRQLEEKRLRELVHEANNPLSIVNNYLHILELKLGHEPEAVEQLRLIGAELRRVSEIISQARELPELEAEPAEAEPFELEDVDLNQLVRQVVELHLGYARDYDVALEEVTVPGRLVIHSDDQRLVQILNNLVRNAIEAGRGARVTLSTVSGVFREGREGVQLSVADTGPGLPRDVLERLAEPKQSSKGGDHSGLGLHIVHRLVGELGGSIDVRTSSGQGTSFTVFLPLTPQTP